MCDRLIAVIAAIAVPLLGVAQSVVDDLIGRLEERGADLIEGIWRLTSGSMATIAIERSGECDPGDPLDRRYEMRVITAPDRSLLPGMAVGKLRATATEGEYEADMLVDPPVSLAAGAIRKTGVSRKVVMRLHDSGSKLEFIPRSSRVALSAYISLPFLFVRPSLRTRESRAGEKARHGALRVYPRPSVPHEPVYF